MPRQRLSVPLGRGVDRATGQLLVDSNRQQIITNFLTRRGQLRLRPGVTELLAHDAASVAVLDIANYRSGEKVMQTVWQNDLAVEVYETSTVGAALNNVASWFTSEAGIGTPRIVSAEAYRKVFFAHDYQFIKPGATYLRAPTAYWDGTTFTELTVDLDRDTTAETVRFRGVTNYLNYMVGWGYGTGSDEDRPELVRLSVAGDPTSWIPEHYLLAGNDNDAVITCRRAGNVLAVFKETESYRIVGYDRATFGIMPMDPRWGCLGAKAAITVGGSCFFWSIEGPRVTDGGLSKDLGIPLDLEGPSPSEITAAGQVATAHVMHYPQLRILVWYVPDVSDFALLKTRCYALDLRNTAEPTWAYWEVQALLMSSEAIVAVALTPPPGYPDITLVDGITGSRADVHVDHVSALGDEITEYWLQPTSEVENDRDDFTDADAVDLDAHTPTGGSGATLTGWEYSGASNQFEFNTNRIANTLANPAFIRSLDDFGDDLVLHRALIFRPAVDHISQTASVGVAVDGGTALGSFLGGGIYIQAVRPGAATMNILVLLRDDSGAITRSIQVETDFAWGASTAFWIGVRRKGLVVTVFRETTGPSDRVELGGLVLTGPEAALYDDGNHQRVGFHLSGQPAGNMMNDVSVLADLTSGGSGTWYKDSEHPFTGTTTVWTVGVTTVQLTPNTGYNIAARHRRGGLFNAGAEGTDPSAWPVLSQDSFITAGSASGPQNFVLTSCREYVYGGKDYIEWTMGWDQDLIPGWQILRSETNDPGTGVVVKHGEAGVSAVITELMPPWATLRNYFFWIQSVDGGTYDPFTGWTGGTLSGAEALPGGAQSTGGC